MGKKLLVALAALGLLFASTAALGAPNQASKTENYEDGGQNGVVDSGIETNADDEQHGSPAGHLPGASKNIELLSRLRLTDTEGGIADVHVFKDYAYLAAWAPECPNGGVHVVDVSDPRNPEKVGFISSGAHDYVGEGVHTIHVENRFFKGDLLIVNHEACDEEGLQGFSVYDITDPTDPWPMFKHFGDYSQFGAPFANSYHSVLGFTLNGQRKAYVVTADNNEQGSTDVDIFNITNPGQPELIRETGLPDWPAAEVDANGENNFHHDSWFKRINGVPVVAVSYWDAGWVFLDMTVPTAPQFIYDTNYPETDLMGFSPPEGNAHQGEWSKDAEYFLGSDEDFSPFRSQFSILTGPNAGVYPGAEFGWTVPIALNFENDMAEGTTVWGGTACPTDVDGDGTPDADQVPDASDYDAQYEEGEERILMVTRGSCFFSEKVEAGQNHGWDMVIVGNHHSGAGGGSFPDAYICGSMGHNFQVTVSGGCTGHRALHLVFDDTPEYGSNPTFVGDMPPIGTVGADIRLESQFDGWGYLNLYDFETGEFLDYYAPAPTLSRPKAFGFGTLSIHEVATDPRDVDLSYIAWYGVGLKVVSFEDGLLHSRATYRHAAGNDFWGVALEKRGKKRPNIFMSDRDSGLWVFRYTGAEP